MPLLTIPKKLAKTREDLIVLPKIEYKALLKRKGIREIKLSASEKLAIKESEKEFKKGDYLTLDEFERYLERSYPKASRKSHQPLS